MAGSGLAHYVKADELLAEIEASPAISNETETSLATRAVAHAVLAAAAAIALSCPEQITGHGARQRERRTRILLPPNLSRASRGQYRLAPLPESDDCSPSSPGRLVTAQEPLSVVLQDLVDAGSPLRVSSGVSK